MGRQQESPKGVERGKEGETKSSEGHRQQFKILSKQMKVLQGARREREREGGGHVMLLLCLCVSKCVCVCVLCELAARAAPKTQTDCGERQKMNEEHKAQHVRLKLIKFARLCVCWVCVCVLRVCV